MSMKQRLAIVERFNSFVIHFEKSMLKNTCNRKRPFDIKDADLSSIELKNIPPLMSKDICQEARYFAR